MTATSGNTTPARAGGRLEIAAATIGTDHQADADFEPALRVLPRLSVRNVELMRWFPRNLTPRGLERNRARFRDAGLKPVSMHVRAFRSGDEIHVSTEIGGLLWAIHACGMLGVSILKFGGPVRSESNMWAAIDILRHALPVAEEAGVALVAENRFQSAFEFPEDFQRLFEALSSPNLGICLDTGHFAASGVDMAALVVAMPGKIRHIDVKDVRAAGCTDFVRFGMGIVDFDAILPLAIGLGYSGYLVVELPRLSEETMLRDLDEGVRLASRFVPEARS